MKYAELNIGDYFQFYGNTFIIVQSFSGSKIAFCIDKNNCGHKCVFNDNDKVEYLSYYKYANPFLSNIGGQCRLDSAPIGQPLYIPETDEYIIKFTRTIAFFVSGERAGLTTVVNVENPMVVIVDHVYTEYSEGIRYEI